MTQKKTWKTYDTWRRVAYNAYTDSREWRHLLKLNPSFDIRYLPAPGTRIHLTGNLGSDKSGPSQGGGTGMLRFMTNNLDLSTAPDKPGTAEAPYFPWESVDAYADRLGDYTAAGLLGRDRNNGFALDSPQAISDTQRG
jgi:hypothetical protein